LNVLAYTNMTNNMVGMSKVFWRIAEQMFANLIQISADLTKEFSNESYNQ